MSDKVKLCECGNCEWAGPETELGLPLDQVRDLSERLDPGAEVPAGECPNCHALAYYEESAAVIPALVDLLERLEPARLRLALETVTRLADQKMDDWEQDSGMTAEEKQECAEARAGYDQAKSDLSALLGVPA